MKIRTWLGALSAVLAIFLAVPAFGQTLYGANGAGGNPATVLVTIDPATGAVLTTAGPIGFAVTGLAFNPLNGVLYGSTGQASPVSPNSIITINITTGAGTLVGPTGLGGPVADIEFRADGTLFGWSEGSDELVTINTATGVGTVVGPSGGLGTYGSGLAFNGGTLFLAGDGNNGVLNIIDPATGLATAGPTLTGSPGLASNAISSLSSSGGTLFGVDLANAGGGGLSFLVTINTATGVVTSRGASIPGLDAIAFAPAAGPIAPTTIPTLSEWAMIVLGLLMLAFGARSMRARRG